MPPKVGDRPPPQLISGDEVAPVTPAITERTERIRGHDPVDHHETRRTGAERHAVPATAQGPTPTAPHDGPADADGDAGEDKELGFIRNALSWVRENVARNPWVRGAVSVAALLIPGFGFLAILMLLLDAVLLIDKLIAGEKITLRDIFPVAAGMLGAAADPETMLPVANLLTAGFDLWQRWRGGNEEDASATAAARRELRNDEEIEQLVAQSHELVADIKAGRTDGRDSPVLARLLAEVDAVEAQETQLASAERDEGGDDRDGVQLQRQQLAEHKRKILVALGGISTAQQQAAQRSGVLRPVPAT